MHKSCRLNRGFIGGAPTERTILTRWSQYWGKQGCDMLERTFSISVRHRAGSWRASINRETARNALHFMSEAPEVFSPQATQKGARSLFSFSLYRSALHPQWVRFVLLFLLNLFELLSSTFEMHFSLLIVQIVHRQDSRWSGACRQSQGSNPQG